MNTTTATTIGSTALPPLGTIMKHLASSASFCLSRRVGIIDAFAPIPAVFEDLTGRARYLDMTAKSPEDLTEIQPQIKRELRPFLTSGILRRRKDFTPSLVTRHARIIGMTPRLGPQDLYLLRKPAVDAILSETWRISGPRTILGAGGIVVSYGIGWQTCLMLNGYMSAVYGPAVGWGTSIGLYSLSWAIFFASLWFGGKPAKSLGTAAMTSIGLAVRRFKK